MKTKTDKGRGAEDNNAVLLCFLDLLYVVPSLLLTCPVHYCDEQSGVFGEGYFASATMYAVGIIFPFLCKVVKKEKASEWILRFADVVAAIMALLSFIFVVVYYTFHTANWSAWFAYILAIATVTPMLFSSFFAVRKYINKPGV